MLCVLIGGALLLQGFSRTDAGFLKGQADLSLVPTAFDGWRSTEHMLDDVSLDLLEPDGVLWRTYTDPEGLPLDFLVVYGHQKKTFHSPGFCLPGGGWEVAEKRRLALEIPGLSEQEMDANLFRIQNQGRNQIVIYWFAHGSTTTPSLFKHNLNLLFSRVFHRRATGALVRVLAPVITTEDDAVRRAIQLLSGVYPEVSRQILL
jgi:EpsI family protein